MRIDPLNPCKIRLTTMTINDLRTLALSFPEASEEPHFEKISFRVRKKIFATYDQNTNQATIKLSEIDQDVFSSIPGGAISPVPNKWGKQGWTHIDMNKVNRDVFVNALTIAYCATAPKKLAQLLKPRS